MPPVPAAEMREMKMFKVTKVEIATGNETNFGCGYSEEDVKAITKGYKFNGLFYERKNGKFIYIVDEQR